MDLHEIELQNEETMRDLGQRHFRKEVNEAKKDAREADTKHGQLLVRASIQPLAEAVEEFVADAYAGKPGRRNAAARFLKDIDPDVAAFIAAKTVLNAVSREQTLTAVALSVGRRIEDNYRWAKFEENNPALFKRVANDVRRRTSHDRHRRGVMMHSMAKAEIEWDQWAKSDCLHVGQKLIDLMVQHTGLIRVDLIPRGKHQTTYVVTPTEATMELIEQKNASWELLCPQLLPMVVPPLDWTTPTDGGYLHPAVRVTKPLVTTGNRNYLEELANLGPQLAHVYDAINEVQRVEWQVNTEVLAVMRAMWDGNVERANLPSRNDLPLPTKPLDIDEDEDARRKWRKDAAAVHKKNRAVASQRLTVSKILWVAESHAQYDAIYFPHQFDFRGRMYALPMFLNPQGQDESKGLLRFANGKPIEDERAAGWLMIHGANTWGEDKLSLEDRIGWVVENEEWVLDQGRNPLMHLGWCEADEPWQFLAFCLEYKRFVDEGYGFVSHLPIAMDGSCNGLQHFSAMLRDPVGGAATNLIPGEEPEDIYQRVADRAAEKLEELASRATVCHCGGEVPCGAGPCRPMLDDASEDQQKEVEMARQWLSVGIDRKTVKRPVMTLPYGATQFSCRDYIEDNLVERHQAGEELPWPTDKLFEPTRFLSDIVWEAIGEVVVAARRVMDTLQQWARTAGAEGLPVMWTTPDGFPVQQAYPDERERRVATKLGEKVIKLSLQEETDKLDRRRQASGISPNFVHSLDGAALRLYVTLARDNGIANFALVHDSIGTLAADTDVSRACIRHAFVDMYQEANPLSDLRADLEPLLSEKSDELHPTPGMLSLDLEVVRESEYFFA